MTSGSGCRSGYTLHTIRVPNRPVGSKTVDTTEMGHSEIPDMAAGRVGVGRLPWSAGVQLVTQL